jgi:hypothetical protein
MMETPCAGVRDGFLALLVGTIPSCAARQGIDMNSCEQFG